MLQFDDVSRVLTVAPQGELDHCMAERIRNTIDATVLKTDAKVVVFDLSEVGFMDSSGIAVVMRAQKRMRALDGGAVLRGVPPQAKKVFAAAGIFRLIPLEEGENSDESKTE